MFTVTTYYKFTPLKKENLEEIRSELLEKGEELEIDGLMLIGTEGVNATISGSKEGIENYKDYLQTTFGPMQFKDSLSEENPFKRWFVKIRKEIVALGDTSVVPESDENNHLEPAEWHRVMEEEDVVVLDTRNTYETDIGVFEGAVDPRIKTFQEFSGWVENCDIPKDKKVLMYCTGGIRCEKASIEMQRQGYTNVHQLKGGILQYMKEFPRQKFEGECFIFDHRAALDQDLKPSTRYASCPHCGDPGDQKIECSHCGEEAIVCETCLLQKGKRVCSKNCAYLAKRQKAQ